MIDENEIRADATFTLRREENVFALIVERTSSDAPVKLRFPLSEEKLREMRARLAQGLDKFREKVAHPDVKLPDTRAAEAARYLESTAWAILTLLCTGSGERPAKAAREAVEEIRSYLLPLFGAEQAGKVPVIRVEASECDPLRVLLPLEFLPIVPVQAQSPTGPVSLAQAIQPYLGFRATIIRSQRHRALAIPRNSEGQLPIRSFSYRGGALPGIVAQRQFFEHNRRDMLVTLDWPQAEELPPEASLARHLLSGAEIIHVACHYDASAPGSPPEPVLDFGGNVTVRLWDLRGELGRQDAAAPTGAGDRPLIFLNACETGSPRLSGETLSGLLVDFGYTDMIGSATLLPDGLAGKFAAFLYTSLLRTTVISKAMLQARLDLVAQCNNPGGILYTFYGNPGLHIAPPPPRPATAPDVGAPTGTTASSHGRWRRFFSGRTRPLEGGSPAAG